MTLLLKAVWYDNLSIFIYLLINIRQYNCVKQVKCTKHASTYKNYHKYYTKHIRIKIWNKFNHKISNVSRETFIVQNTYPTIYINVWKKLFERIVSCETLKTWQHHNKKQCFTWNNIQLNNIKPKNTIYIVIQ